MKTLKINNDIYNLSKTLYGAERFKLVIEAMRVNDSKGDLKVDHLPRICTIFDTVKEGNSYRKIILDFYVINFVIVPMLDSNFSACMAGFSYLMIRINEEEGVDDKREELVKKLSVRIVSFFKLLVAMEKINEKYNFDLLTYANRDKINSDQEMMKDWSKLCTVVLRLVGPPKIANFTDDEVASDVDLVEKIFATFYSLSILE
jgi:hypothetical protein